MSDPDWSALPAPDDDGAADHLVGTVLPDLPLPSTAGADVSLGMQTGRVVIFCYPMIAGPDGALPEGWQEIPGAPGCTAQARGFRDLSEDLRAAGAAEIFGLSTQDAGAQVEASRRLDLPFALLSDYATEFAGSVGLPVFDVVGARFLRRLSLIVEQGTVQHVHYPVFPPDADAEWVLSRLRE